MDERHVVPYSVEGEGSPSMVEEHPDTRRIRHFDLYLVLAVAG